MIVAGKSPLDRWRELRSFSQLPYVHEDDFVAAADAMDRLWDEMTVDERRLAYAED